MGTWLREMRAWFGRHAVRRGRRQLVPLMINLQKSQRRKVFSKLLVHVLKCWEMEMEETKTPWQRRQVLSTKNGPYGTGAWQKESCHGDRLVHGYRCQQNGYRVSEHRTKILVVANNPGRWMWSINPRAFTNVLAHHHFEAHWWITTIINQVLLEKSLRK